MGLLIVDFLTVMYGRFMMIVKQQKDVLFDI